MRKVGINIETVKMRIAELKGKPIKMVINRGRKKVVKLVGEINETYPSVFTIKVEGLKSADILSYSYSDVLCGDVKIALLNDA